MQKASPLVLILILAVTASGLSLCSQGRRPLPAPAPTVAAPAAIPDPSPPAILVRPAQPAATPTPVTPRPWPQTTSDIAPDAGATFGTLPNGFRYLIYPHSDPPKRLSLRLHIASGSLMEADDQQGLSHFLEHMMFNGTTHFAPDDLVPRMQRLGIAFGAHVNAFTSFDETVYMLDLPDITAETQNLGFSVMRDFSDGASLTTAEIDKERGVILSEKISRDTVNYRLMKQQFATTLPNCLFTRRFPIGSEDVIKTAPRERFVDLYSRYYTPQRMTFIVVGDVNPADMRSRIETTFSSMTAPTEPAPNPEMGEIHPPEGIETSVLHDKEVAATEVSLTLVRPYLAKPDTTATRADLLALTLAHSILDRRLERITKEKNSPVAEGSATRYVLFDYVEMGSISITAADDRWREVVPILEHEWRRAMNHGFTASELAEAKSNLLNSYQQAVVQQATRKSETIATDLAKSVNEQTVFSDPATNLAIATRALNALDLAACHRAFKAFWDAPGYHLTLTTKDQPANAKQDLAALFEDARGTQVEAIAARAIEVFDYTDFGPAGRVASRKEVADLAITQLVLSNHVRVNLKHTGFEQGRIHLLARVGAGKLTQPQGHPMLDEFATAILERGGLGKHSADSLQQICAGRNVASTLAIADDAFTLSGATTPADFTLQCQLMCATLIDPGYRDDSLWQFQKEIPMLYQKLNHTPSGPEQEMNGWLHGGDSRFTPATATQLASYTLADAKKWLTPELTRGYLELTIVGDFDSAKILPDLLATFGALPARAATAPVLSAARRVTFPTAPAAMTFCYDSKIPQAVAINVWKSSGIRGYQPECRRLNLLAAILGDRMRQEIREKLGASYSPHAVVTGSDALDGMGYILAESIGKPADLDLLSTTMRDQADQLANQGATADELERALKPTLGQLDQSLRDNRYWLTTVMSQCQADPKRLALARSRDADYRTITVEEINTLAKKYLTAAHALCISIKPKD